MRAYTLALPCNPTGANAFRVNGAPVRTADDSLATVAALCPEEDGVYIRDVQESAVKSRARDRDHEEDEDEGSPGR